MKYNFNEVVNRKNTSCYKWDLQTNCENLPFWIADSDYKTAPFIIKELKKVSEYGIFGYNEVPSRFNKVIKSWYKKRYDSDVNEQWIVPYG